MIVGALAKYALPAITGLCVLLAAAAGVQTFRLHLAESRLETSQAHLQALRESSERVNLSNLNTIAELQEANLAWSSALRATSAEVDRIRTERDNAQELAQDALQSERDARQEIYRNDPPSAAWASTRVPAGILRRLREHDAAR